jgi:hypothetical protein
MLDTAKATMIISMMILRPVLNDITLPLIGFDIRKETVDGDRY